MNNKVKKMEIGDTVKINGIEYTKVSRNSITPTDNVQRVLEIQQRVRESHERGVKCGFKEFKRF